MAARSARFTMAASVTSAANKGFIGMVRLSLICVTQGDDHEAYGNGTSLGVRTLQHLPICPQSSSRVERDSPHAQECCALIRLASELCNPNSDFSSYGGRDVW